MRKLIAVAVAFAALSGLAACDNFSSPRDEDEANAAEAIPAEPIPTDPAPMTPPPATTTPTAPSGENTALPPDTRSSEESVKPESETMFY